MLPIRAFVRARSDDRDPLAFCLVGAVVCFSAVLLALPFSATLRSAAARRFHLAEWPLSAWALVQPLPSMYNFENAWEVTFTPRGTAPQDLCRDMFHGFINHHIFNRVLLQRAALEQCGLPARVRFRTTFRSTTVESRYLLTPTPNRHGFSVVPDPE